MATTPQNTEEDYYMNESFDDDVTVSDVEEDAEAEEDSDSPDDTDPDPETEFLYGNVSSTIETQSRSELTIKHFSLDNVRPTSLHLPSHPQPHARRQQIFGKNAVNGSGFSHKDLMKYESSSDDESQVVITKTFAEVNQSKEIDEETLSDRTLLPGSSGNITGIENFNESDAEIDEVEDNDVEDELAQQKEKDKNDDDDYEEYEEYEEDEDEEIVYDNEDMLCENSDEENGEDVELDQTAEQDHTDIVEDEKNAYKNMQNPDLIDVEDCGSEDETDDESTPRTTDDEMKFIPVQHVPRKQNSQPFPNLQRTPVVPADFEKIYGNLQPPLNLEVNGVKLDDQTIEEMGTMDSFNVKFLEQQMTQMSDMIMKAFRLSGGAPDNMAFEKLKQVTKIIKTQDEKELQMDEPESEAISDIDITSKLTSPCSDKVSNRKCRCPSISDINGQDTHSEHKSDSLMMEECGQGDGLRYSDSGHQLSNRIDCRVSSVTPTSFNSDSCGYHFDIRRPCSSASSEKFK